MTTCRKCNKAMSDHLTTLDHMFYRTGHIGGLLTVYDDGAGVVTVIVPDGVDFDKIMILLSFATVAVHRMRTTNPEPMQ